MDFGVKELRAVEHCFDLFEPLFKSYRRFRLLRGINGGDGDEQTGQANKDVQDALSLAPARGFVMPGNGMAVSPAQTAPA